MNKVLALTILGCLAFLFSCNQNRSDSVSEEELGLRKTTLYEEDDTMAAMASYAGGTPGTNERMERSFENAPPLIPHTVEGFLPIKINSNLCLTCHMPAVAEKLKATPIPKSHFTNYRTSMEEKGGIYLISSKEAEVVKHDLGKELYQGRFNCSQCHVPQANITVAVENIFTAEFRDEADKSKSNFDKIIAEGVQ